MIGRCRGSPLVLQGGQRLLDRLRSEISVVGPGEGALQQLGGSLQCLRLPPGHQVIEADALDQGGHLAGPVAVLIRMSCRLPLGDQVLVPVGQMVRQRPGLMIAAQVGASDVEVKGPHICCRQCVSVVNKVLAKVDGVSNVVADAKGKKVTFTAKDDTAAAAGVKALIDGGFFGKATSDGKEIKVAVPAVKIEERSVALSE